MWDLRWVLLGLGALVVVGIYLWSRGIVSRDMLPALQRRRQRTEPSIGDTAMPAPAEQPSLVATVSEAERARPAPDRIVALRLVPRREGLRAERAVALTPRSVQEIAAASLSDSFFDFTWAYRFGPPPHDVTVAALVDEAGVRLSEAFHFPQGRGNQGPPPPMTFFVTSTPIGKGGNLGGLAGADAHCQTLASAVGAADTICAVASSAPCSP